MAFVPEQKAWSWRGVGAVAVGGVSAVCVAATYYFYKQDLTKKKNTSRPLALSLNSELCNLYGSSSFSYEGFDIADQIINNVKSRKSDMLMSEAERVILCFEFARGTIAGFILHLQRINKNNNGVLRDVEKKFTTWADMAQRRYQDGIPNHIGDSIKRIKILLEEFRGCFSKEDPRPKDVAFESPLQGGMTVASPHHS